jgi:predicted Zn-dependent protease
VAVRHTAPNANNMALFDDFTFNHVSENTVAGIETAHAAFSDNAQVAVYSLNGIQVANGKGAAMLQNLEKGVYVVKVTEGQNVKTLRIVRK